MVDVEITRIMTIRDRQVNLLTAQVANASASFQHASRRWAFTLPVCARTHTTAWS
jgi:hypothetical protein